MQYPKASPQLRVALTPKCNLHCFYCRPEGEGWANNPKQTLERSDIRFLLEVASEVGFTHVKFTGGEPLLRKDSIDIVRDAVGCAGIVDVQMVTNGTLLANHAHQLGEAGLSMLTVSIDAANANLYREIRGGDLHRVLKGLSECVKAELPLRINMVVSRRNVCEIPSMIQLALRYDASLKLLDLDNLDAPDGDIEWSKHFVSFSEVVQMLKQMGATFVGYEAAPGGVGAPLIEYRTLENLQVVLKDSMLGTSYHATCSECRKFPCQDAIISLRVTHDGQLKKCLIRDDNLVPVREYVKARDGKNTLQCLTHLFQIYAESEFLPGGWKPPRVAVGG